VRIARRGNKGSERPIVSGGDGIWRDASSIVPEGGIDLLIGTAPIDMEALPTTADTGERFGQPLQPVGKIICVGLNYRDHAAETGSEIPIEPILFLKTPDTVVGPDDELLLPRRSLKMDWEVELAVVIGAQARYLKSPDDASSCIAGYAVSIDVSEREFQLERGGQWDKGKNCETFNPLGPWIVTSDSLRNPHELGLRLWVNGILRQDGNSKDMIFDVNYLVWYISQFMVLRPGDLINTGTPAGVAMGLRDQPYLKENDVVVAEIDGLGKQHHTVGQA
jgi:2-keto-4-pentenoate hydratase/2-oxohepta-3-ene-1,7-dioic acid hydratase in catechol pathway